MLGECAGLTVSYGLGNAFAQKLRKAAIMYPVLRWYA